MNEPVCVNREDVVHVVLGSPGPTPSSSQDRPSASRRCAPRPGAGECVDLPSGGVVVNELIDASHRFSGLDRALAKHPAGKGSPGGHVKSARDLALEEIETCAEVLQMAKDAYEEAVFECKALGIPNTVIAKRAGRTEAAIRMFVSRKKNRNG